MTSSSERPAPESSRAPAPAPTGRDRPETAKPQTSDRAGTLFREAAGFMEAQGCTLTLMVAPADSGTLRLTILGQHRRQVEDEDEQPRSGDAASDGPPFTPITLVATPEQLDDSAGGLQQLLKERAEQSQTLSQARERARQAHEQALKAEERREKQAQARKEELSENGPLFSGADAGEGDAGEDDPENLSED